MRRVPPADAGAARDDSGNEALRLAATPLPAAASRVRRSRVCGVCEFRAEFRDFCGCLSTCLPFIVVSMFHRDCVRGGMAITMCANADETDPDRSGPWHHSCQPPTEPDNLPSVCIEMIRRRL